MATSFWAVRDPILDIQYSWSLRDRTSIMYDSEETWPPQHTHIPHILTRSTHKLDQRMGEVEIKQDQRWILQMVMLQLETQHQTTRSLRFAWRRTSSWSQALEERSGAFQSGWSASLPLYINAIYSVIQHVILYQIACSTRVFTNKD